MTDDTVPSELVDMEERVQQALHGLLTGSSSAVTITSQPTDNAEEVTVCTFRVWVPQSEGGTMLQAVLAKLRGGVQGIMCRVDSC